MRIVTARLLLRDPRPEDARALAAYQADPRYLEHYREHPDAEQIVLLACQWADESPRLNYQLVVEIEAEGLVIGCVGLRRAGHPAGQADLGVEIDPRHWGTGLAREALSGLIEFGRRELGVERLQAVTESSNARVHRLLRGLGFTEQAKSGSQIRFELAGDG